MSFRNDEDFDADSYVRVNERLKEFWAKYPDGRVETGATISDGVLILNAKLYRKNEDANPAGTGHAFLTDPNGDKVGEYTETVAVGRALAMMGFRVEKSIASSEEMDRFKQTQETKTEPKRESRFSSKKSEGEIRVDNSESDTDSDAPQTPSKLKPSRTFNRSSRFSNNNKQE